MLIAVIAMAARQSIPTLRITQNNHKKAPSPYTTGASSY
jgi:hypothetical protein